MLIFLYSRSCKFNNITKKLLFNFGMICYLRNICSLLSHKEKSEYLMLAVTVIILRKNQRRPKTNSIHGI